MSEETATPSHLLAVLNASGQQALADAIGDRVRNWLIRHGWVDSLDQIGFRTYQDHFSLPPRDWPVAAVMYNNNQQVEDRLCTEGEGDFWEWFGSLGLSFSTTSPGLHEICVPDDSPLSLQLHARLASLQAFEWHAHLVAPDYAAIYRTVFEHFGRHPEHLANLHWRRFEELCASVFEAQGYTTVLGPGANDGGVDIHLTEHPVYGQQLTVVSVKRYREKIGLELVASILGVAHAQSADRSLFITSSSFLPSARKFAQVNQSAIPLHLADGQDIAEWCRGLLPNPDWLVQQAASWNLDNAKIIVADAGVGMTYSAWAAVVAETPLAARLVPLNGVDIPLPSDPMLGTESPDLSRPPPAADQSFTARRNGDVYVADDGRFYHAWAGTPRHFNHAD
ncbi:restriction endonuclease [Micromonospora aurantiaca (nom. illeg.)]|uniref:restriction endonuclease n=1 Tax=Micromonospora aurantiaca (nom. illeg.) TaxID=47850 RepID=UPI003F4A2282